MSGGVRGHIRARSDATRAGGQSGKVGSIALKEGPKRSTASLKSVLGISCVQPFLSWGSETKHRCPRTLVPDASIPLRHQARAVSECGWGSGYLSCRHRLCGSSVATWGHSARRMTPRDNRFRAEEPEPPSCSRHTSEGPSEKPGQSHSLFSPPRPWAAVQEAFKHPVTWPSLGTQLITRSGAQAPSGWSLGVGYPAGPPTRTLPPPPCISCISSSSVQGFTLLMDLRVEESSSLHLEGNHLS